MLNSIKNVSFSGTVVQQIDKSSGQNPDTKPVLDKIVNDSLEISKKDQKEPSLLKRFFCSPLVTTFAFTPLAAGEAYSIVRLLKMKKQLKRSEITKEEFKKYGDTIPKKFIILGALAIPLAFVADFLNKSTKEKRINKANKRVEAFNKENNVDLKLKVLPMNLQGAFIGALADPLTGQISLNQRFCDDMILSKMYAKPFLNHELVHMQQFMLMGCAENGVNRLNFDVVKAFAKGLNDQGKKEVKEAYQEIQNGLSDKYQNSTIDRFGYKINLADYITAMYKVIYEKETTENDIPIIINKDFYEKVKKQKGKLSEEEEKKAQAYFEAFEKYPTNIGFTQVLNLHSDYRTNLLEQEASKNTPWYAKY